MLRRLLKSALPALPHARRSLTNSTANIFRSQFESQKHENPDSTFTCSKEILSNPYDPHTITEVNKSTTYHCTDSTDTYKSVTVNNKNNDSSTQLIMSERGNMKFTQIVSGKNPAYLLKEATPQEQCAQINEHLGREKTFTAGLFTDVVLGKTARQSLKEKGLPVCPPLKTPKI